MSEEISKWDERIAEVKKLKEKAEEREKQREAILAKIPKERRETAEEATAENMVAIQKLMKAEDKLMKTEDEWYRAMEKVKNCLLKKGYSEEDFKTIFADEVERMREIRMRGSGFSKPPSGDRDKISKAVSLGEIEERGTKEESVWEFLEVVKGGILVNNPDKFVTIKEIANTVNWEFEGYAKILHFLCLPLSLSPDIKIEEREDEDHSLVAYKYKPDAQFAIQKQESYRTYSSFIRRVEEEENPTIKWGLVYRVKGYYTCIKKVVEFFKEIEYNRLDEIRRKRIDETNMSGDEYRERQKRESKAIIHG